ncbi:hypothetical protein [Deinococcus proteolyticus]|uniref:hypothetical protein n=1 Tax=Deinococcus proteolyticus TaxID=55148 RepID=UPI0011D2AA87|nr:hypothetical protein [Deinococcus proteolyticus]
MNIWGWDLLAFSDLLLLRKNLKALLEVPYFNAGIYAYITDLLEAIDYCTENFGDLDPKVVRGVSDLVWSSYTYISNSNTKEIPYELEYLLQSSLSEFVDLDSIIITAFTNNKMMFHFYNANVISGIQELLPQISLKSVDTHIIQVAMPKFYSRNAIYMIPMYHELGHFMDRLYNISEVMLLNSDSSLIDYMNLPEEFNNLSPKQKIYILKNHLAEYFCDTFAACFVGETITDFLAEIGASDYDSETHPATFKRKTHIENFLLGIDTPITQSVSDTVALMGMKPLARYFEEPNVSTPLTEAITVQAANRREVHGLLVSYWKYLKEVYSTVSLHEYSKEFNISNDLIVKSIRNYSIREKWENVNSNA